MLFWFVLVYGSKPTYKNLMIPVTHSVLPSPWAVKEIEPKAVEVALKGTRKDFYFLKRDRIKVFINPKPGEGTQRIPVYAHNILLPNDVVLESFEPHEVSVSLNHPEIK